MECHPNDLMILQVDGGEELQLGFVWVRDEGNSWPPLPFTVQLDGQGTVWVRHRVSDFITPLRSIPDMPLPDEQLRVALYIPLGRKCENANCACGETMPTLEEINAYRRLLNLKELKE